MHRYLSAMLFALVVSTSALATSSEMTIKADKGESTPENLKTRHYTSRSASLGHPGHHILTISCT